MTWKKVQETISAEHRAIHDALRAVSKRFNLRDDGNLDLEWINHRDKSRDVMVVPRDWGLGSFVKFHVLPGVGVHPVEITGEAKLHFSPSSPCPYIRPELRGKECTFNIRLERPQHRSDRKSWYPYYVIRDVTPFK